MPLSNNSTSNNSAVSNLVHVFNCATVGSPSNVLLMTCVVAVRAPDGSTVEARALLDSGSSASFISERVAQSLQLSRHRHNIFISRVACLSSTSPIHAVTNFSVLPTYDQSKVFNVVAIIVPRVTCDLPLCSFSSATDWSHIEGSTLADPQFTTKSRIDILLGVEIFSQILCSGQQTGVCGTPNAVETQLGWVLAGAAGPSFCSSHVMVHHAYTLSGDDLLRKFWEMED